MARILIADDERDIRDLVTFTLRFAGHRGLPHQQWRRGLSKKRKRIVPDLILMDVRMPRMTGYEACRNIKLHPELQHIPVVFLSAKGQESEVQTGLEAGATRVYPEALCPGPAHAKGCQLAR